MNWFVNASLQDFGVHVYVYYFSLLKKKIRKSAYHPLKKLFFRYQHSGKNGVLYSSEMPTCVLSLGKTCAAEPSRSWDTPVSPGDDQALFCFCLSNCFLTLLLAIT